MKSVGFIGIGAMGKGMMKNLLQNGFHVCAYDVNASAMAWAEEVGAEIKSTPWEVGNSAPVVMISLPGPDVVREVVTGEEGVLSSLPPGSYLIDTSTIDPETAIYLYNRTKEKGIHFFDCPVSGGPMGADAGNLTVMVGGDKDKLPHIQRYLDAIGNEIIYMGEPGAGQVAKLCHNAVVAAIITALGEVFVLGAAAGVDPRKLAEVIDKGSAHNRVLAVFGDNILSGSYDNVKFRLDHMYKDISLYLETARKQGTSALIGAVAHQLYKSAKLQGKGGLDSSAVCQVIEGLSKAQSVEGR
jgi:3-hydroxyisobutyrate dehydrogenase